MANGQCAMSINLRPSSWLIPILWPIIWAIVPASKCGSYTLISTLIPTAFVVHTVSGTATPASPPANVSPLKWNKFNVGWSFGMLLTYYYIDTDIRKRNRTVHKLRLQIDFIVFSLELIEVFFFFTEKVTVGCLLYERKFRTIFSFINHFCAENCLLKCKPRQKLYDGK